MSVCFFVCLSVCMHISGPTRPNFTKFIFQSMLPVAMVWSSSSGIAIMFYTSSLWMASCLHVIGCILKLTRKAAVLDHTQSLMSTTALLLKVSLLAQHQEKNKDDIWLTWVHSNMCGCKLFSHALVG